MTKSCLPLVSLLFPSISIGQYQTVVIPHRHQLQGSWFLYLKCLCSSPFHLWSCPSSSKKPSSATKQGQELIMIPSQSISSFSSLSNSFLSSVFLTVSNMSSRTVSYPSYIPSAWHSLYDFWTKLPYFFYFAKLSENSPIRYIWGHQTFLVICKIHLVNKVS